MDREELDENVAVVSSEAEAEALGLLKAGAKNRESLAYIRELLLGKFARATHQQLAELRAAHEEAATATLQRLDLSQKEATEQSGQLRVEMGKRVESLDAELTQRFSTKLTEQSRTMDEKASSLDQRLARQQAALEATEASTRRELSDRAATLARQMEDHAEKLQAASRQQAQDARSYTDRLRSDCETRAAEQYDKMEKGFAQLAQEAAARAVEMQGAVASLRRDMEAQAHALQQVVEAARQQAREAVDRLRAESSSIIQSLRTEIEAKKASRDDLGNMFIEIGMRLAKEDAGAPLLDLLQEGDDGIRTHQRQARK